MYQTIARILRKEIFAQCLCSSYFKSKVEDTTILGYSFVSLRDFWTRYFLKVQSSSQGKLNDRNYLTWNQRLRRCVLAETLNGKLLYPTYVRSTKTAQSIKYERSTSLSLRTMHRKSQDNLFGRGRNKRCWYPQLASSCPSRSVARLTANGTNSIHYRNRSNSSRTIGIKEIASFCYRHSPETLQSNVEWRS